MILMIMIVLMLINPTVLTLVVLSVYDDESKVSSR